MRGVDRSGRMERELDHWQRGSGVLTLQTVQFGEGLSRTEVQRDGPDRPGGIQERREPHFPGGASLLLPRASAGGGRTFGAAGQLTRGLGSP